jgi:hypothetical protein
MLSQQAGNAEYRKHAILTGIGLWHQIDRDQERDHEHPSLPT